MINCVELCSANLTPFVQTAAELQKRGDNFFKEIEVVISDVVRPLNCAYLISSNLLQASVCLRFGTSSQSIAH